MRLIRKLKGVDGDSAIESLKRTLRHPDPAQLSARLDEVVRDRVYLRHGVSVNEGDVVFDVGASVGVAAAFFATECGAGVVHSFEPVKPIFELLSENLRHFPACVPHDYGLSSLSGTAVVTYYPEVSEMSGLHADPARDRANLRRVLLNLGGSEEDVDEALRHRFSVETISCELRTVSQVIRQESVDQIDLLKIDVEGAEREVLAGIEGADWRRIRQISGELHLEEKGRDELLQVLSDRGFSVTVMQDASMEGTPIHMFYAVRP